MSYDIEVDVRAAKDLVRLPKGIVARLHSAITSLGTDPRPPGAKKLTGRDGYRIRVGDYRVLYEIEDDKKRIRIYRVGHRQGVYR